MGSRFVEQVILKQLLKLDSQKPPFCQHSASLLYHKAEIRLQFLSSDYQGFSKQSAVFGSSNVKDVCKAGNICQGKIINGACKGSSHAGAVHEQKKVL